MLTNEGLHITRPEFDSLKSKYTAKTFSVKEVLPKNIPTVIQKHPRILRLYRILNSNTVQIARSMDQLLNNIEYKFEKCKKITKYDLGDDIADHQKIVLKSIVSSYANVNKCGTYFCQMATGMGKSRLGIALIGKVAASTMVIVPTKHIANQWIEEMQYLVPELKVCLYSNPKDQSIENYDVMIVVINTARNKDNKFFSQFALCIIDEVHECVSKINKEVMWLSSGCRFVLGLSATPEDTTNQLLPWLEGHLGKVKHARDLPGYNVLTKNFKVYVEVTKYIGDVDYLTPVLNTGGTVSFVNTLSKIISDPLRVELIINKISKLYDGGNNILVFAEHRKYLDSLYDILIKKYKKEDINLEANVLKGGATPEEVERCKRSRIILTTFCYSRRGIDYSHLNSLVLATPRKSGIKQILGRILRFRSDERIPRHVVDIWDYATVLKGQLTERKRVYNSRNYPIKYSED